jgi:predicted Zn-dependent protease
VSRTTLVLALCAAATAACVKNPATGERQLVLVPEGQAKALGEESAAQIVETIGLVEDAEVQGYVASIGKALASTSERPELPWTFQVLDDASVNAFALPGGYIFVTRGLLAHLGSEAELAGVLGHEIGHVTAKHSVDQLSKAQLAKLGLGLGGALSEDLRKWGQVGAVGLQVMFLKYGRDDEYQADELGVRYAGRGGYDVREMPKVFEALARAGGEKQRGGLPEWLATHPTPENRIERIRETIAAAEATGEKIARDEYLRKLDGLAYGKDPRQGYLQGNRYVHPGLGFEVTLPDGWKTTVAAQGVSAESAAGDALMQLAAVEAESPAAALEAFLAKEGIQAGARAQGGTSSTFQATTEEGVVGGLVSFLGHGGKTFALIGLAKQEQVPTYLPAFEATRDRFAPITDASLKDVAPQTLAIVEAPRAMTLAELHEAQPSAVPLDEVALINALSAGARLEAGQLVKTVRPGKEPAPR